MAGTSVVTLKVVVLFWSPASVVVVGGAIAVAVSGSVLDVLYPLVFSNATTNDPSRSSWSSWGVSVTV